MATELHQWATFHKGRLKVKACLSCGEVSLPSNSDSVCTSTDVLNSQIFAAGFRLSKGLTHYHSRKTA